MRCPACQHENADAAKFCGKCGEALAATVSCRACGSENPRSNEFCSECGRALSARPVEEPEQPVPEAERRQHTVMFCDLVDSTELSQQLGPEGLREAVRAYQETCGGVSRRFEGHVAEYPGDGLLVYFGYPQAHKDDAARFPTPRAVAAYAGLVPRVAQSADRDHHGRLGMQRAPRSRVVARQGRVSSIGPTPDRIDAARSPEGS